MSSLKGVFTKVQQKSEKKYWIDPAKGLFLGDKFLCSIVSLAYDVRWGTFDIDYLAKTGERKMWSMTREHILGISSHKLRNLLRRHNIRIGSHFPMRLVGDALTQAVGRGSALLRYFTN